MAEARGIGGEEMAVAAMAMARGWWNRWWW